MLVFPRVATAVGFYLAGSIGIVSEIVVPGTTVTAIPQRGLAALAYD